MPAAAKPVDELPDAAQRLLADVARVSRDIGALQGSLQALIAERHTLFARAHAAGAPVVTIASLAGVSGPAVTKALAARGGS